MAKLEEDDKDVYFVWEAAFSELALERGELLLGHVDGVARHDILSQRDGGVFLDVMVRSCYV